MAAGWTALIACGIPWGGHAAGPHHAGQYSEFDDPVYRQLYYQSLPDGSQTVEFYLEGVHCAACVCGGEAPAGGRRRGSNRG